MTVSDLENQGRERWLFLGSALVLIIAVLIGLAREQRWGQPMVMFRMISSNATGLRPGQEVRISGQPVGQLRSLQLQPDASVAIQVEVAQRYAPLIGPSSVARQGQEGFVGDRYLEISPDPQIARKEKNPSGQRLRYEQPLELAPLLQQLVQTQKELQATLRNTTRLTANDVPQTLREARLSLKGVHSLASTLQRESAATAPDLRDTLRQINRAGSNVEKTSLEAQQLLRASQPELFRTLNDLQTLTNTSHQLLEKLLGLFGAEADKKTTKSPQP
jgi:phospholipid/cholesterol/gamma-HCH transport system substrate-binding protein